jgi:hypothetical protein
MIDQHPEQAAFAQESAKLFPARLDDAAVPLRFTHVRTLDLSKWDGSGEQDALQLLVGHLAEAIGKPSGSSA